MQAMKLFALSALAVLVFDAIASAASLALGFPYPQAAMGSTALYAAFAYYGGRKLGLVAAVLLGATMGLTDATLGWAVSWAIGPGRLPPGTLTPSMWLFAAAYVVALGAVCGLLGGGIGALGARGRSG